MAFTDGDCKALVSLVGKCGYKEDAQRRWRHLSQKLLKELRSQLAIDAEIRFNAGGIAVSGDAILHGDNVYVSLNADGIGDWILCRSCKGRKDYTGGINQRYAFARLLEDGVAGLTKAVATIGEGR